MVSFNRRIIYGIINKRLIQGITKYEDDFCYLKYMNVNEEINGFRSGHLYTM